MTTDDAIRSVFEKYGPQLSSALRSEATASGIGSRTGKLSRSFKPRVREDAGGVWGLSFTAPRYAFIHEHGVTPKTVNDPTRNRSYKHAGLKKREYMARALDRLVPQIEDDLVEAVGDAALRTIRIGR